MPHGEPALSLSQKSEAKKVWSEVIHETRVRGFHTRAGLLPRPKEVTQARRSELLQLVLVGIDAGQDVGAEQALGLLFGVGL